MRPLVGHSASSLVAEPHQGPATAMAEERFLKRFSGDDDDPGKALKRWKLWCTAKMMTMKDLKPHQKGPWVFTLLDGKAWEAVENMTLEDIGVDGGDQKIWQVLESRFPEKEPYDQMGGALGAVFALSANEGESLKAWTGRVRDTFEQCKRKGNVDFPEEAKGWILLHCCGLSEEQRAITKAKSQGQLGFETVAQAMRSCFPEYKAPGGKRRAIGVLQADATNSKEAVNEKTLEPDDSEFQDVEAFLSEHQALPDLPDDAIFTEEEAAEALAVSWSERRKEIAKVKQSRQFGGASASQERRSFRVEIEELKRRTKCRKCGKVGHWARECRSTSAPSQHSSSPNPSAAGYVQCETQEDETGPVPAFVGMTEVLATAWSESLASGLVSSPGYGVVDSGCGKTLIGEQTLLALQPLIAEKGFGQVVFKEEANAFRFGNGAVERTTHSARLPVGIGGVYGLIDAAVISGAAPLLLGRPTLIRMGAKLDFEKQSMSFLNQTTAMHTNQAGQLLVDILNYPKAPRKQTSQAARALSPKGLGSQLRSEQPVRRDAKVKVTLKKKECRCLLAQMEKDAKLAQTKCAVAELFSSRFCLEAEQQGRDGLPFTIQQGWDLSQSSTQVKVDRLLDEHKPELLVCCPPWEPVHRARSSPLQMAWLLRKSRSHVRFCVQQIRKQLERGGEFLFEHPWSSAVWDDAALVPLRRKFGVRRVDMCAYGLICPDSTLPPRNETGLIMSRRPEDHGFSLRRCDNSHQHRLVDGKFMNTAHAPTFTKEMLKLNVRPCVENAPVPPAALPVETLEIECMVGEDHQARVEQAVRKLHANLGHPSNRDLVRILQHGKASQAAIVCARDLQCTVCENHRRPASALPAKSGRVWNFNDQIGLDVKYLPGWKPNQRVPCISIVDYASSLHVMAPIFHRETADLIKGVLRDAWIQWAGPPAVLELDPSRPNLSEELGQFCEQIGIDTVFTAAESHWQLGKVERHGQWFEAILNRVNDEHPATTPEEFVDNVMQTQVAKNSLITEAGASPYQIVFGRNPRAPHDLMQDEPHVPSIEASQFESPAQRAQAVRQSARLAVLECQDSKALRAALRARPRPRREFMSGDWVYFWRTQKWQEGQLIRGGRWHGAGMLLGKIGVNWIVAHRRSIFRCSPEQLRLATDQEKTVAANEDNHLLGIKNLLESGQFPKSQFVDLVQQGNPPAPEDVLDQEQQRSLGAKTAAELFQDGQTLQSPAEDTSTPDVAEPHVMPQTGAAPLIGAPPPTTESPPKPRTEDYGPIKRVRHSHKSPPLYIRPSATQDDDLADVLNEAIPRMIDEQLRAHPSPASTSPRHESHKRDASVDPDDAPDAQRPRVLDQEALLCQPETGDAPCAIETLVAAFMQKRAQKELPVSGNSAELQHKINVAKTTEWETLTGKSAVRVWTGAKAREIRRKFSDRFIGSRFVVTNKVDEEGERVKARWCLQGHLDPDFQAKIASGACHSPTLHPLSRALILQILASRRWVMQLGDIKGAFLEAGPLQKKFTPLFAHQPQGGIPGIAPDDVIEVTGNVYGANDAPFNWFNTFDEAAKGFHWEQSQFDKCLYFLRAGGQLCGVMGAHVDDTITGGEGPAYEEAIASLKKRFPYRKWRVGNGEFCGVTYFQDPRTYAISYSQKEYAEHLRPINLTKERLQSKDSPASEKEVAMLRAINGAANWLSSQTRPDLAVQTSFSQQCFPSPKVSDLVFANQLVHRAKQHSHVEITVQPIPWEDLAVCFHSDAGFGNAKAHRTQAGYIAAFVDTKLPQGMPSKWSPFAWKSYKLPRVVESTLAGEAQSFTTASAVGEWMTLLLAEAQVGKFDLRTRDQASAWAGSARPALCRDEVPRVVVTGITDCKSLYDNLTSMSSISKCDNKRIAIDLAILQQCMERSGLSVRWCPSELMLADGLTKDQWEPSDLLRAALQVGEYQLNHEATILNRKRIDRAERAARRNSVFSQASDLARRSQTRLSGSSDGQKGRAQWEERGPGVPYRGTIGGEA